MARWTRERRLGLAGHGQIALAPELERLERDLHGLGVLLAGAEPQAPEGERGHRVSVAGATSG